VDVTVVPLATVMELGLAKIEKSEPLTDVTVTEYVPGVFEVTVNVALFVWPGVKGRMVALSVAVRLGSETDVDSVMLPLSPRLFSVMVEGLLLPVGIVRLVGFAEIVKSLVIVRDSASFLVIPPPVPVTVRV